VRVVWIIGFIIQVTGETVIAGIVVIETPVIKGVMAV
jgi:hypothetical protein